MNFRKNSLARTFIQRVGILFILMLILLTLFYRWLFPTYYYWKMEQPVKEAQKMIQTGEKEQLSKELVQVSLPVQNFASEEELTDDLTFRLNREGISLNRFWVDQTTIAKNQIRSFRSTFIYANKTKE